ncbi:MAG TPA: hypothetical protein VMV89_05660, partial [Candidatus Paceibacterota bacterium]|nr:hypothetical protein [Candidatus Paceibacterota bacterium]
DLDSRRIKAGRRRIKVDPTFFDLDSRQIKAGRRQIKVNQTWIKVYPRRIMAGQRRIKVYPSRIKVTRWFFLPSPKATGFSLSYYLINNASMFGYY